MILMLLVMIPVTSYNHEPEIKEVNKPKVYFLNKDSVDHYPLDEVMAAIAYHECLNLSPLERWLVMEAFHNRIIYNFNGNGATVKDQLLAPKQFTGLWKYCPQWFIYDENNEIIRNNREMAMEIISGARVTDRRIFYWAGKCDRKGKHGRFVKKKELNYKTINWFR